MILFVYSVYDSKVGAYLPPLFMKSRGEFLRAFAEAANDSKGNIAKYPADYMAFELGTWDDSNAQFSFHVAPLPLGLAIEYLVNRQVALQQHNPPDEVPVA